MPAAQAPLQACLPTVTDSNSLRQGGCFGTSELCKCRLLRLHWGTCKGGVHYVIRQASEMPATQDTHSCHWDYMGKRALQHHSRQASMAMFRCIMGSSREAVPVCRERWDLTRTSLPGKLLFSLTRGLWSVQQVGAPRCWTC